MRKFLKTCVLFVLPIIVAAILVEIIVRRVPNPYKYKYEWMMCQSESVETLVLGSSHTFYGVRTGLMGNKAFNLANVSQSINIDLSLLQYWADRYKNLKTVIIPISYSTWFSHGLENGPESYRCRYYKIYMDCDLYSDCCLLKYNLEISDVRTALGKLDKLFKRQTDCGCDEYGWGNTYTLREKNLVKWNDGTEAAAAVKRHTSNCWDYVENNYALMGRIADFCRSREIRLVLITTPCWSSYYENLNPDQVTKMYELTHRLQAEYGLDYFDYLADSRFVDDDFFDSNHLSDIGAEKFTKILCADLFVPEDNPTP